MSLKDKEITMNGKTHGGVSAVAYVTACSSLSLRFSYLGIALVVFASLLPDIDHPKSIFNRYIFFIRSKTGMTVLYSCLGILILWMDYIYFSFPELKALGASFITVALSSHRNGLTHSLSGLIIFTSIASFILTRYNAAYLCYVFMLGYACHLICDMATNRGVPLFYPFSKKKYKFPLTYRVGSKLGNFIEQIIMMTGLIYTVYKLPNILKF
jgi:inner membrane protein